MKHLTIATALTFCLAALPAQARIWRVDNTPTTQADFTSIQAAHDAATSGDTVYVSGSLIAYDVSGINLSKRLFLFGPGYFLSQIPETQANPAPATIQGDVNFQFGSEGSLMTGMSTEFTTVRVGVSDITIKRNHIGNLNVTSGNNTLILQNYINGTLRVESGATNAAISNNLILSNIQINAIGTSAFVTNNVFSGSSVDLPNSEVRNNILISSSTPLLTNSTVQNNFSSSSPGFGTADGNQTNRDPASLFLGPTNFDRDAGYQLKVGSPAIGAGLNGEDVGMFGGLTPYVLSGLPTIPAIYFFDAPTAGSSADGLPVQIRVKSHN